MVSELVANITNSDTPVLRSIYVPEGTVQFEFFVRRSWVNTRSSVVYVYSIRESKWYLNSQTVEPDRPQYDRHAACVIARQYSSTIFVSSHFHPK